jgi:hypothetical protein
MPQLLPRAAQVVGTQASVIEASGLGEGASRVEDDASSADDPASGTGVVPSAVGAEASPALATTQRLSRQVDVVGQSRLVKHSRRQSAW